MADTHNEVEVYREGSLIMTVSQAIDPAAVALLKSTIYGTHGVRYQQTGQETKIDALKKPLFFYLRLGGQLIGMYCLDERSVSLESDQVRGFYGRYLAVNNAHLGKGYGNLLKHKAVSYVEQCTSSPFLLYSYIESKNVRSVAISEREGFRSLALLKTFFFRRYAPQIDARFSPADKNDVDQIKLLLRKFYDSYRFNTFDSIGFQNHYFVLKEGGQVLAGMQANPICWRFFQMPGFWGWVLMNLVPLLKAGRRFFNPQQNTFLVVEGIYFREGRSDLIPILLESVLAHFGKYSAMCEIDQIDPLITLLEHKSMGPLSGFQKNVTTQVLVKAVGLSDQMLLSKAPFYVSSFDYS